MKISIVCAGRIKEPYLAAGIADFTKRLLPYCKVAFLTADTEKMPDDPSPALKEQVLARETARLLALLPEHAYVVLLDLAGTQLSSPELAARLDALALAGHSHVAFVIGGAFGYTDALRQRADFRLCFSRMTFTHQMIRLLLLEQLYRAFKISRGEKYHW